MAVVVRPLFLSSRLEADVPSVIHRADYQRVLVEEAKRLGVELRLKADVQDIDFERTGVTLRNGAMISGDVIIGADGNCVLVPFYSFGF